jgi:tRNA modification GTPase
MSATHVAVLTPPGSAAVAVLAVRGPAAWPVIRELFRTTRGDSLSAPPAGFQLGRIGDRNSDEVILSAHNANSFEIHCHGGRQVVSWLLDLIRSRGIAESDPSQLGIVNPWDLLPLARTPRTAAILLDQARGAYASAVELVARGGPKADATRCLLRRNARVGQHLVDPWKIAIAGPPNAGKSSLLNALAGFDRSVVSPIPGTTRDAVSVSLAFDGWPVDLFDTAGLRDTPDAFEREGTARARSAIAESDLILWVVDATGPGPASAAEIAAPLAVSPDRVLVVLNKMDIADVSPAEIPVNAVPASAVTSFGLSDLAVRLVAALVPEPPQLGDPVPFTPEECDRWSSS